MSIYQDYGYENKFECYNGIAKDYNVDVSFVYNIAVGFSEPDPDICDLIDVIRKRLGYDLMEDEEF